MCFVYIIFAKKIVGINSNKCAKDVFGFHEHQKNSTYGLGYMLTLKRKTENDAKNKAAATANAIFFKMSKKCHVPHYAPKIKQQRQNCQNIVYLEHQLIYTSKNDLFFGKM